MFHLTYAALSHPGKPYRDALKSDSTPGGISHSVAISLAALVLLWGTPIRRDAWIGVVFGHLPLDALTMMGVPILDERSRRITIFGGKLRTASPGDFVFSGTIAFIAFAVLRSFSIDTERRNWTELHKFSSKFLFIF